MAKKQGTDKAAVKVEKPKTKAAKRKEADEASMKKLGLNRKLKVKVKFPLYQKNGKPTEETGTGIIKEISIEKRGYYIKPDVSFTQSELIFRSESELIDE